MTYIFQSIAVVWMGWFRYHAWVWLDNLLVVGTYRQPGYYLHGSNGTLHLTMDHADAKK